jgi:AraC-like DNA-binding protein
MYLNESFEVLYISGAAGRFRSFNAKMLRAEKRDVYPMGGRQPQRRKEMISDPNNFPKSFDIPGFVSENRPEVQEIRSVSRRSERPLFFARYRHDRPNLGLLEPTPLADQVTVAVELRPFRPINVFCDGRHRRKPASEAGALALYDLRKSWCADIRDPFDNLSVYIPFSSFRDFAAERGSSFLELRYDVEEIRYDAVMLHLMQAMVPVLEKPSEVNTLYLDSLFLAVRDHVATTYGTFSAKTTGKQWGLTARQLRHALEYIEANLSEDVSLGEIARASAASVSSLARGFKIALGVAPHRWVLNRRVALAQRLMYEGATPLSEVAAACGFADQSHLTRVFMRHVGSSPTRWRSRAKL